jgi:FtsZ-binding cell division protein ZapB
VTIEEKIQAAYDTLTAGRPAVTDGQLTVSGICAEAGISRASFYRSPLATRIRADLADPASTRRPEAEQLRVKVRELTAADKELRSKHAAEIRDLRATVRTYANQIQLLTLRISQLEDGNKQLTARLQQAGDNITPLNRPLPATRQPTATTVRHQPRAATPENETRHGVDTLTDHITIGQRRPAIVTKDVIVAGWSSGAQHR